MDHRAVTLAGVKHHRCAVLRVSHDVGQRFQRMTGTYFA
jgi:hypothetical protein